MDIRLGAVREEDITFSAAGHAHTGGAQGNTLGLDALQVDQQSAENAGAVTVNAVGVTIVALPSMTVAVGDRVLVYSRVNLTKGATAGITTNTILKTSGTAVVVAYNDFVNVLLEVYQNASEALTMKSAGLFKVTTAGTLTLGLRAASNGSDGTVAIGDGQLHALVLRGTG
jgi:hypothetical protein